jgi:hypothetical protein
VNWRREKRENFNFVSENLDFCGFSAVLGSIGFGENLVVQVVLNCRRL